MIDNEENLMTNLLCVINRYEFAKKRKDFSLFKHIKSEIQNENKNTKN